MKRRLAVAFGLLFAVLPAACADSTSIEHEWRAPDWKGSFKHVLVLGLSNKAGVRRDFETSMVAALANAGLMATPSRLAPRSTAHSEASALARARSVLLSSGIQADQRSSTSRVGPVRTRSSSSQALRTRSSTPTTSTPRHHHRGSGHVSGW